MTKERRKYVVCSTCGGKSLDLERHKNGNSKQCDSKMAAKKIGEVCQEMRDGGWAPVRRAGRLLRKTKAQLRNVPTVAFGPDIVSKDWAENWAVAIATLHGGNAEVRQCVIDKICMNPELRAAVKSAFALAGYQGIEALLGMEAENGEFQSERVDGNC